VADRNEDLVGGKAAPARAPVAPPVEEESVTPAQIALAEQLVEACKAGFEATQHLNNWKKKHKAELDTLPESLKAEVRKAVAEAKIVPPLTAMQKLEQAFAAATSEGGLNTAASDAAKAYAEKKIDKAQFDTLSNLYADRKNAIRTAA